MDRNSLCLLAPYWCEKEERRRREEEERRRRKEDWRVRMGEMEGGGMEDGMKRVCVEK